MRTFYDPMFEDRNWSYATAILSLAPGAKFTVSSDSLDSLDWQSEDIEQPTNEAIEAEQARLKAKWEATEYQRLRENEYPPVEDYLDAVVKADQDAIDAYIAACQAVKDKYPKPE